MLLWMKIKLKFKNDQTLSTFDVNEVFDAGVIGCRRQTTGNAERIALVFADFVNDTTRT
jgi:hypothetical protein